MRRALRAASAAWLLASCSANPPSAPRTTDLPATPTPALCRIGPDGGPILADRGIGGTGAPAVRTADRGIGGTGAPQTTVADRGIGGTGIIGVITGFASICVGGREVGFDPSEAVEFDGRAGVGTSLRAGQVAVIEAGGTSALQARRVAVRHEVSGPVEAVEETNVLRVAGQRVAVSAQTLGDTDLHAGDWAEVSGLRDPDGTIVATRIDRREAGLVVVHGLLQAGPDGLQVGQLRLRPMAPVEGAPGQLVTAFGRYDNGVLRTESVVADILAISPDVYFGPGVGTFLIESYAVIGDGRAGFGRGFGGAAPGLFATGNRRVLVEYARRPGGVFATGVREAPVTPGRFGGGFPQGGAGLRDGGLRGGARARGFEPAPMPNRSARFGDVRDGQGGARMGDQRGGNRRGDRSAGELSNRDSERERGGGFGGDGNGSGPGFGGGGGGGRGGRFR